MAKRKTAFDRFQEEALGEGIYREWLLLSALADQVRDMGALWRKESGKYTGGLGAFLLTSAETMEGVASNLDICSLRHRTDDPRQIDAATLALMREREALAGAPTPRKGR